MRQTCDNILAVTRVNKQTSNERDVLIAGCNDRLGRPVEFDNDSLKSLVEADPKLSIQELSRSLGSTWSTIQRHLHEMGKAYRQGICVPHQLSETNNNIRRSICTSLLSRFRGDPFLSRIVTGDEKWILCDNIKRSKQWLSANQTAISTPKPSLSLRKVLLCILWDCRKMVDCP
ncbi:histone-lysine N-methyltransferase SETMAR-like [Halictus rubicundus]|uniref:histone-lysine N-methyltransferase SETMAR-like n=1 Tax=Halictus rubicundus TaxID=77578 RepID=UPI0040365C67